MNPSEPVWSQPVSSDAIALPADFIDWQIRERQRLFEALERGEEPRSFAAHLPVVSTIGSGTFPIRSCNKGVGMTPRDELIPELQREIDDALTWAADKSWQESQPRRIEVARWLYEVSSAGEDRLDHRRFGLIEIFRGGTYENLQRDPRASLLFTGEAPNWRSYQVNVAAELLEADDPRFRAIRGLRMLFESNRFHIQQPHYPMGYLFWVREVIEKTPLHSRAGRRHGGR